MIIKKNTTICDGAPWWDSSNCMVLVPLTSRMPWARRPNSFANVVAHTSLYLSFLIKCQYSKGVPIVSSMIALHAVSFGNGVWFRLGLVYDGIS